MKIVYFISEEDNSSMIIILASLFKSLRKNVILVDMKENSDFNKWLPNELNNFEGEIFGDRLYRCIPDEVSNTDIILLNLERVKPVKVPDALEGLEIKELFITNMDFYKFIIDNEYQKNIYADFQPSMYETTLPVFYNGFYTKESKIIDYIDLRLKQISNYNLERNRLHIMNFTETKVAFDILMKLMNKVPINQLDSQEYEFYLHIIEIILEIEIDKKISKQIKLYYKKLNGGK